VCVCDESEHVSMCECTYVRAHRREFVRVCVGMRAWTSVRVCAYAWESECTCIHAVNEWGFRKSKAERFVCIHTSKAERDKVCVHTH